MPVRALVYLGVESPRAREWLTFGPSVLGMEADEVTAGTVKLRMDDSDCRMMVYEGEQNRVRYLGWDVGNPEALDDFVVAAESRGLPYVVGSPDQCAARGAVGLVRMTDPVGFEHELVYGLHVTPKSFHPGRPMSGFVTGTQGLGHVVLVVPNVTVAEAFYMDMLGHRKSDEAYTPTGLNLKFYHYDPRHHSVALAAIPGMRGLHHVMIQVRELDDVGIAYDICRQQGLPISMTLGRHTNDRMVSFYVRSPAGFDVEYGWGAIEIDDQTWSVATLGRSSLWGHETGDRRPGALESVSP